jgi:hypothetical protein
MNTLMGRDRSLFETILALIGRSPITVANPIADLPPGFTAFDVAVLDGIAAEGRRIRGHYALH